jgi:hypothetical protein
MHDGKLALAAARLGALCALGPGLILFGWYYAHNGHLPLPWGRIALITVVLAPFTGAAFGGFVRLFIAWFDRHAGGATRRRFYANPISAGVLGGALASIVTGVFAVAVFGSYHGPFVGTLEITAMLFAGCLAIATLLTVEVLRGSRPRSGEDLAVAIKLVVLAGLATAAVTIGSAILVMPSLFSAGVLWTARAEVLAHGAVTVGCVVGLAVGAILGMHLGFSIWLGRRRSRAPAAT